MRVDQHKRRRLCQHADRVRLLEQDLQDTLPALTPSGVPRATLPIAVNADSLATWFAPALAAFAAESPVLLNVAVDDQDHTAEWLRSGAVLAAVTAHDTPATGCNSRPLGAMRYVAAASPAFVARHLPAGIDAQTLAQTPSLEFNAKDTLEIRWVQSVCGQHVELPKHTLPSSTAFVTAALAGMGWGMLPDALAAPHLATGTLVELVPGTSLDVPLHWQQARATSTWLDGLTHEVLAAARGTLAQP